MATSEMPDEFYQVACHLLPPGTYRWPKGRRATQGPLYRAACHLVRVAHRMPQARRSYHRDGLQR